MKPDWSDGKRSVGRSQVVSCLATSRSKELGYDGQVRDGQYDLTSAASRPGFLMTGVTPL